MSKFRSGYLVSPTVNNFSPNSILRSPSANILFERRLAIWNLLSRICYDTVNRISAAKKPDPVWPIGSAQSVCAFSFAMVALRSAALGQETALAREFYHVEALRGGWSVRQLDRQIASQFYERTAASRNKSAMLAKEPWPPPKIQSPPMMKCAIRSFSNFSG